MGKSFHKIALSILIAKVDLLELVGANMANLGGCIVVDMENRLEKMEKVPDSNCEVSDATTSWEHRWNHLAHLNPCI